MRFVLHVAAAALVVAIGMGDLTSATAADRSIQAQIRGRQKIRAELAAALEKGYLTRMDQYHILLDAKEVLNRDDLRGLEQTLSRIGAQQAAARRPATTNATTVKTELPQDTGNATPTITPSNYEAAELPTIADPAPKNAKALKDAGSVEEVPAGIGKPAIHLDNEVPEGCECDPEDSDSDTCRLRRHWVDFDVFSSVDAFKGPIDLGDANGNFGLRSGFNSAVSVFPRLGFGLQAGLADVLSNLKGTPYPEPNATSRNQVFVTVGMFQRINREQGEFTYGFAYDWLFDNYYSDFHFGQWRVKGAWSMDPCNEIGIEAAIPEHGDSGQIPTFFGTTQIVSFKPIAQGDLYWTHTWCNDASVTGRLGVAERPGEFTFGVDSRVPLTESIALTNEVSYIMPDAAGGAVGQTREIWNVSVGIEFVPGGFGHGGCGCFKPFIPVANNGSMAVRELGD